MTVWSSMSFGNGNLYILIDPWNIKKSFSYEFGFMIIIMITYRDSGFRPCKETLPWISQHIATHHRIFHLLACLDTIQTFEAILKTHETQVAPQAHLDKPSSGQQKIWSFFFSSEGLVCVLHFLRLEIHLWNHLSFFLLHSLSQSRDLSQV